MNKKHRPRMRELASRENSNGFIHFYEQRGDARRSIVTSRNPSRLSRFFSLRFCARCRGKMQTIIQGTIGWTRLSLVIGNESSSGRGQSLEIARAPLLPVTLSRIPSKDSSNFYRDPGSERLSLLSTMDRVRS